MTSKTGFEGPAPDFLADRPRGAACRPSHIVAPFNTRWERMLRTGYLIKQPVRDYSRHLSFCQLFNEEPATSACDRRRQSSRRNLCAPWKRILEKLINGVKKAIWERYLKEEMERGNE